jgi:enoyl-CoA hydratase/carnithine racemase
MSEPDLIDARREGRVAYLTLDRAEARNLVTYAMSVELADALRAAADADVMVIAARGEDFTLGRDQADRPPGVSPQDGLARILEINGLLRAFQGISVAVVRGRALGFGSGLVLHCDLAVAGESAVFGFDEIAHGFPPLIVEEYLTRYVPRKTALDLVLTGHTLSAAEAQRAGMVARVVPDASVEAAGAELVSELAARNPRALSRAKRFFDEIDEVAREERPAYGMQELVRWRQTESG